MNGKKLKPASPGEILLIEFLEPMGVSQNALARATGLPPSRVNDIIKGRRAISADTALRFGLFFGMSAEFWMNAQADYDLRMERLRLAEITREVQPHAA